MSNGNLASIGRTRSWEVLLRALRDEFRKWDLPDYFMPTKADSRMTGKVVVEILARSGNWKELVCERFDTPEQNLMGILSAVEGVRKMDQRGIIGLLADATELIALPAAREMHPVLGVYTDSDQETLRAAYRDKLKKSHPDHGGNTEEFERVREAGRELGLTG